MKLIIEIEMDNDAFTAGNARKEVHRILKEQVLGIVCADPGIRVFEETNLRDINGNTVGFARVTKEKTR